MGELPHPMDMVKMAISAFIVIFVLNHVLRGAGMGEFTTRGE